MNVSTLILVTCVLGALSYFYGRRRAFTLASEGKGVQSLHSLPSHYGSMVALWCILPAIALIICWKLLEPALLSNIIESSIPEDVRQAGPKNVELYKNQIDNLLSRGNLDSIKDPSSQLVAKSLQSLRDISRAALVVLVLGLAIGGATLAYKRIAPDLPARHIVEKYINFFLIACASIAILTTLGIVLSVLFESIRFFQEVPLFLGTMLISAIAMIVAVPFGLMSAIYLAEYASRGVRNVVKPLLEILAGIPTVVYGFFAALTVAPFLRSLGADLGLSVSSESALAAGAVMGIMIIPFVSSLSDDVITAVPQSMRDGSFALGSTHSETIRKVVIPAALPGIVGGILLAVSRAIGETMIVVMAAGLAAKMTANPLDAVTTVTVQIVTLLTGDQEFDSAKTLAAFALGLMLFVITLCLNVIALQVVRRYREQYD